MAEGLRALFLALVMGGVSHAGGRKSDKYYIFLAGGAYAGIEFIKAWIKFTEAITQKPLIKGTIKVFEFLTGMGS